MMLEVIAAALVGAAVVWLVLQPLVAPGRPAAPGVRAARSRGNAQGRGPGGAQGDRVRPGDGEAVGRGLRLPQAQVHGGGARCAPGGERGSVRAGRGRRWRCRGHDRCQGSSPSLRRDFGAARRAGLPDMWSASGAGRGVLLLLRAPPPAGRCLRRLRRRARPRQPVLHPMRQRRGGVTSRSLTDGTADLPQPRGARAPGAPAAAPDLRLRMERA